ncbi:MAG: hypothetical protein ACLQBB_05130 [Solirubrobacteraceae bacterium]
MLFDLRGRGRRRTVRVIYIGLAVLIGVGLVGFGVGGGLSGGGIFNAASSNESSGSASFSAQIKKYEKQTRLQPNNVAAWEQLAKALLHEAGGEGYTTSTGAVTPKGKELFRRASQAWASYLALNPPHPNAELAELIYRIYGEEGLNEPAKAVEALNYVVEQRPTASYYAYLAIYAYKAHNERLGDLAAAKAISLAPSAERTRLKNELAEAKTNPSGSGQTYTTTTNGKTYALKKAPNGTFTGTQITTTPAPTTTTKK